MKQMTFAQDARALRDKYESVTGVRPPYPRSSNEYSTLASALKHYELGISSTHEAVRERMFQDEFARLRGIDDIVKPKKQTFGQRAKALRDKYETATGTRPEYPRTKAAYNELEDNLNQFMKNNKHNIHNKADKKPHALRDKYETA